MKKIDRIRERVTIPPTSVYLSKMHDAGWRLVALEWEREIEFSGEPPAGPEAEAALERHYRLGVVAEQLRGGVAHELDDLVERERLAGFPFDPEGFRAELVAQARDGALASGDLDGSAPNGELVCDRAVAREHRICPPWATPVSRAARFSVGPK